MRRLLPKIEPGHRFPMRVRTYHRLIWIVVRLCGVPMGLYELVNRSYEPSLHYANPEDSKADDDVLLPLARQLFEDENARAAQLEEKVRTLLTISGILFPLAAGLTVISDSVGLGIVTILLSLATISIILEFFGVDTIRVPDFSSDLISAAVVDRKRLLMKDYLASAAHNNAVNNFKVDLYRVARRLFLVSLVFLATFAVLQLRTDRKLSGSDGVGSWPGEDSLAERAEVIEQRREDARRGSRSHTATAARDASGAAGVIDELRGEASEDQRLAEDDQHSDGATKTDDVQ